MSLLKYTIVLVEVMGSQLLGLGFMKDLIVSEFRNII